MDGELEAQVKEFEGYRSEYVWCGLMERRHHHSLCSNLKTKNGRVVCGYRDEIGACTYITKEEKIIREKADAAARELEEEEKGGENNDKDNS